MATTANSAPARKREFAERVSRDANAASRVGGGLGLALAIYAALIVVASLSGAFGTHSLGLGPRFAFWTALILWNAMKWHVWFSLLARRKGWTVAIAAGAVVLNLPLPLETRIALGLPVAQPWREYVEAYFSAVAISLAGGVACTMVVRYFRKSGTGTESAGPRIAERPGAVPGLGVGDGQLWGIEAEDHYVRLLLADGRKPLFAGRFGDALAQVGHIDGCRIHRGRWVADAAVAGVEREGRGWRVILPDGRRLTVSASHVGSIRERGWIGRTAPPPR
jgi:hypothetical protein